jgi:hypothetical protein
MVGPNCAKDVESSRRRDDHGWNYTRRNFLPEDTMDRRVARLQAEMLPTI